jgi:hypothetical protein
MGNVESLNESVKDLTLKSLILALDVFVESHPWVSCESTVERCWEWYEENLFNESRLYKALGKEDARSVLGIWRRFKEACLIVRKYRDFQGITDKMVFDWRGK